VGPWIGCTACGWAPWGERLPVGRCSNRNTHGRYILKLHIILSHTTSLIGSRLTTKLAGGSGGGGGAAMTGGAGGGGGGAATAGGWVFVTRLFSAQYRLRSLYKTIMCLWIVS
jgi:hypothetical protein